jgi:hypothetical protein
MIETVSRQPTSTRRGAETGVSSGSLTSIFGGVAGVIGGCDAGVGGVAGAGGLAGGLAGGCWAWALAQSSEARTSAERIDGFRMASGP